MQLPLLSEPLPDAGPLGLSYWPEILTPDDEAALLSFARSVAYGEVRMRGQVARRRVAHFGWDYGFESWAIVPGEPLPEPVLWLRERCAELVGLPATDFEQVLVTEYPPGAGIGWHRDAMAFGRILLGVSLGQPCVLKLRKGQVRNWQTHTLPLAPRSLYALADEARWQWQHSIPPTAGTRYSITFRTLARP